DLRPASESLLPPPLLSLPAGPEPSEPGGPDRDPQDHRLLAGARGFRLQGGCRALPDREQASGFGPERPPLRVPRGVPPLHAVAGGRRDPARRSERSAGGNGAVLR